MIYLKEVKEPKKDCVLNPVELTDQTMIERKEKVLKKMEERGLDALCIYADLEHGNNFEYLVGYLPRFEEALLVLHVDGKAFMVMGNENLNKVSSARLEATAIHAPYFSLPNQLMEVDRSFVDILKETKIQDKRIGVVGWKYFTSLFEDNKKMFDIPMFIMDALISLCGIENITNEIDIFIGENGARTCNNANEIAHYEFGASLASDCMLDALNSLKIGIREIEVADQLSRYGQKPSVVTIAAFGKRFVNGNMYPTNKKLEHHDPISLTVGYKGGLSSRAGYALNDPNELDSSVYDYIEKVCAPYFLSICTWLESIHVGMTGNEMFEIIEDILPKSKYNWSLNPGHLTSDEEWLSSCIYKGSKEVIQSGMLFQTDIIPSIAGYAGTSVESTICIADEKLQKQIAQEYPKMYQRMMERRTYIINELGIQLNEDVLPMASTLGYMRPLMLSKKCLAKK